MMKKLNNDLMVTKTLCSHQHANSKSNELGERKMEGSTEEGERERKCEPLGKLEVRCHVWNAYSVSLGT